jgi:hypothetical protein
MTRLLLIGNSHLAAFRKGWARIEADNPDVTVDFFALSGAAYYALELDAEATRFGALTKARFQPEDLKRLDRLNDKRSIDITGYDQVMIVGNQHGLADLLSLIAHRDVDGLRETGQAHRISADLYCALVEDLADAFQPHPMWHRYTAAPLTFHAMPRPADTVFAKIDTEDGAALTYAKLEENQDGVAEALADLGQQVASRMAAQGWRFLEQPQDLMNSYGFTQGIYNARSESFAGFKMTGKDYSHMNAAYGAACLHAAFPDILTAAPAAQDLNQRETSHGVGS